MPTLKEKALAYKSRDITDLDKIPVTIEIKTGTFEKNGKQVPYDYMEIDGWKYSIKADIIKQIQSVVIQNPSVTHIRVKKAPNGMIYVEAITEAVKV